LRPSCDFRFDEIAGNKLRASLKRMMLVAALGAV